MLRRADRVVAICGDSPEVAGRGVAPERIAVVPERGGAGLARASPTSGPAGGRLGIGRGPVFGYLGSFSFYEGLPFLVEAAPDFLGSSGGGHLLLVGGGRDEAPVRAMAQKAGRRVIFMGRVPRSRLRTSTRCWMCWCCRAGGPG